MPGVRNETKPGVGRLGAGEESGRIEIAVAGPHREVEGSASVGEAARADRVSLVEHVTHRHLNRTEEGVTGSEIPSVFDRHGSVIDYHPGKGHPSPISDPHRRPHRS